jgi:4-diphosphocytidyl-2-C-methyl-D-erythritol kinase
MLLLRERAFAKVNLVLQVGPRRDTGLHEICSLFASIDLADEIEVRPLESGGDRVVCPPVAGENLAARALASFREAVPARLPPLELTIDKRIPVAAGLGGGSADAAAALRAANELAGRPLGTQALRELAAGLGSDVPSQVDPHHALVTGTGERVEQVELPPQALVLAPQSYGLATAEVYAELDRLGAARAELDPDGLRSLEVAPPERLATGLANDLQDAALSLRPELQTALDGLRAAGALGALVSGSGPTCFGLFPDLDAAQRAAASIDGALVVETRP